jgi:hypothetical protein
MGELRTKTIDPVEIENKQSQLSHKVWELQKTNPVINIGSKGIIGSEDFFRIKSQMKENELYISNYKDSKSEQRGLVRIGNDIYRVNLIKNNDTIESDSDTFGGEPPAYYLNPDNLDGPIDATTFLGQGGAFYLDRANHTGSYDMGFIRGNGSVVPPVASTVYWLGHNLSTASGVGKMFNPVASVIDSVCFQMTYFGTPTTQTFNIKISVNGVETSLSTTMFLTGGGGASITHNVTGLNLVIPANTYYVYKVTMPAWTTAPTQLYVAHITHFKS